jgi:toxin ParE1/3/4
MPQKRSITFAVSAVKDLEEIKAWYIDRQVPDVGERLLGEVVSQVERLAKFPESGREGNYSPTISYRLSSR